MKNPDFLFELAAAYVEKYKPIYRQSILRRFPGQAAELRELFDLTEQLDQFFQRKTVHPDPKFRATLKAQLMAQHEAQIETKQAGARVLQPWEWEMPRPDRRWTAVGIGSAVAVAGVIAAYWRNRDGASPAA